MAKLGLLIVLAATTSTGQLAPRPAFSQFPATRTFHGKPAKPKLVTKDQRLFRTMIRAGGQDHGRFAGHYTIAEWGCGTDCSQYAVVDSITGRVYGPFSVAGLPWAWLESRNKGDLGHIDFTPTSRLLKVNGCPNERDCGLYDYEMIDGTGLTLLRKELLPHEYQPD